MRINYESDFKLYEVSWIDDTTTPFRLKYRTSSLSSYTAEFDGENYTNCRRLDDGSLLVIFENHKLDVGELRVRREHFLTDSDFADNICNRVTCEQVGVTLVRQESENDSATVEIYPTYQQGQAGYTPVKGVDYYTEEDKAALLAELNATLSTKIDQSSIAQEVGSSSSMVMSQEASTTAFVQRTDENLEAICSYGIQFDISTSTPTCTRIGNLTLHQTLPIQSQMRGCLLDDDGQVVSYLPTGSWLTSTRDGSQGQVMVEIPEHYRKCDHGNGTVRKLWISEYPLDGYTKVDKCYISAYEASIYRPMLMLSSVVNTTADYRGGDNTVDYDDLANSLLGRPCTNLSLDYFRPCARMRKSSTTEWNCMTYEAYKTLYWLITIEYATLNIQSTYTLMTTDEGYKSGGLGDGATALASADWATFNGSNPFIPCGYTDTSGNGTTRKLYTATCNDVTISTYAIRYRGIENPFGHIWKWADGVLIKAVSNDDGALSEACFAASTADYNSTDVSNYQVRGEVGRGSGYINETIFEDQGDILAYEFGGASSSTYFCDYVSSNDTAGTKAVMFGGAASSGDMAGLSCVNMINLPSAELVSAGSRLCFHPNNE